MALPGSAGLAQSISRGRQLILQHGLQIQAMVVPDRNDPGITLSRFADSKFTGVSLNSFDRTVNLAKYLGPAPGLQSGLWNLSGSPELNSLEAPYLPNMVSLQYRDELNVGLPAVLNEAQAVLAEWRQRYPNVIGYMNHISSNSDAQLRNYLSVVKPDMVMFATYPFNGNNPGGSPTDLYVDLQRFRQLGLGGHDGTGAAPIPYAQFLQSFTWPVLNNHYVSGSEMRLNQFAGWAFGATFATAFIYLDIPNESDFIPVLFNGAGDVNPRQPAFGEMAETNRQSRNLGPALINLVSTDVRMQMGEHRSGNVVASNTQPAGVPTWSVGAAGNPFLTNITATNDGATNDGLDGDVIVGHFRPLAGGTEPYFMVVNGLSSPTGSVHDATQQVRLEFDFGTSGVRSLLRLNRHRGTVEIVPLTSADGNNYFLESDLEGGAGDLYKFNNGTPFVGNLHPAGGFAIVSSTGTTTVDGDGTSLLHHTTNAASLPVALSNGNMVSKLGADVWRLQNSLGAVIADRQLDNLGSFNAVVAAGSGGYAAVSDTNLVFMAADGISPLAVVPNVVQFPAALTNGNIVGKIAGADIWRVYSANGNVLATRVLDNLGTFTGVAPLGNGGYAATTDSRVIFVASDGTTVHKVVDDALSTITPLTNGNLVGRVSAEVWKTYSATGEVLATRVLDNLGTFTGAAALGGGGFVAYSDLNSVFLAPNGQDVLAIVPGALEQVTSLRSGNIVGKLAGTSEWRLFDPFGNLLATKSIENIGAIAGVTPLGTEGYLLPGDYNRDNMVDAADYNVWRDNLGSTLQLQADGNSDGRVNSEDYYVWRSRFAAVNQVVSALAVPEPTAMGMSLLMVGLTRSKVAKLASGTARFQE